MRAAEVSKAALKPVPFRSCPALTTIAQSGGGRANKGSSAISFVGERAGIARDRIALEAHEPQRVGVALDEIANDRFHAFVRQSLVWPVHEIEANVLRQSLDEAIGGGAVWLD